MAEIIIGDYRYNTDGSVKCVDNTKQAYGPILSEFEYNGRIYTVTSMNHCFDSCSLLTQAPGIPSSVTDMGGCFYECSSLTQAPEIPSGVTNMSFCFGACSLLTQAPEIPSSVTDMGGCFHSCINLIQAPEIPSGVTDMEYCFEGCSSLTQAPEIPSSVTDMGNCFRGCSLLTQAPEIPNGVINMRFCFSNCSSLTQAPEIPSSVISMRYCFNNCTSLTGTIIIHAMPTDKTNIFTNTIKRINILPVNDDDLTTDVYDFWVSAAGDYSNVSVLTTGDVDAEFIIGDYIYKIIEAIQPDSFKLSVKTRDKSKTQYEAIKKMALVGSALYTTTSMHECFRDCMSLIAAPEILDSIVDMSFCFASCKSIKTTPLIPTSVENMEGCFSNCESLIQALNFPLTNTPNLKNMMSCFAGCTSLESGPKQIPKSVENLSFCFQNCKLLQKTSNSLYQINNGGAEDLNMEGCFSGCETLKGSPDIPHKVSNLNRCFEFCYELKGNIIVRNNPIYFDDIFNGITKDIYIVNYATSTKEAVAEKWRTIVSDYDKVHYEADDHPVPQLSLSVRRTDENKKSSSTGSYLVFQKSYIISQDLLPENFTPAYVESEIYKLDNEVILPVVDASGESEAIQLEDSNRHIVSYTLNDGYKTRTITANLSKIMAILDFLGKGNQAGYIDLPGMGMAIGNIATRNGLDIQFPTTIGEGLLPPTTNKVYTKAELPFDSNKTYYILNDDEYEEVINPIEEDIDNYYELTSQSVDLSNYQLVIGKYNKRDDKALFIIGNGTEDNRKNSFIIDEDGYMDVVNGFEIKVEDKALLQFLKIDESDTRIRLGAADGSNIVIHDLGIDMFHILADKNANSYIHNDTAVEILPSEDLTGSCLSLANNSDVPNGTINKVELRAINGTTYNNWAVVSATIKKLANGTNQNIVRFDANRVESRVAIVVDSDRRLKKHINYLDKDAIDFCRELKPVIYSKNDEKHLGFYAQDVKEINKWDADLTPLINKDYMGLSYDELIAPLVAYCQYLEKRIDELETQK